MITIARIGGQVATKTAEMYGLVKDVPTLPTEDVPNASQYYCMDSGDVYMFDKENSVWIKQDF